MEDKKKEIDELIRKLAEMLKQDKRERTRDIVQRLEKLLQEYLEE